MPRTNESIFGAEELLAAPAGYNPGSVAVYSASSSWAAIDATNLVVANVIVPPTGNLMVRLSALMSLAGSVASGGIVGMWGVDLGGGTPLDSQVVAELVAAAPGNGQPISYASVPLLITGQTPGASVTVRWMHAYAESTGATITSPAFKTYAGQSSSYTPAFNSPARMEVWAA